MKYLVSLITIASFTVLALGLSVPFKALVAQQLLELAWAESQARQHPVRPWPTVIAGHRDTHCSGLEHLKAGSELKLQRVAAGAPITMVCVSQYQDRTIGWTGH